MTFTEMMTLRRGLPGVIFFLNDTYGALVGVDKKISYVCKLIKTDLIMAKVVTDENFSDIISGSLPVVVDFWATWCGPCRALAPVVEEVASEYEGKVVVAKCNVDDCEDIPVQFGIRSIPTLLFFKNGQMVDRIVGAVPKADITAKLDALLQ